MPLDPRYVLPPGYTGDHIAAFTAAEVGALIPGSDQHFCIVEFNRAIAPYGNRIVAPEPRSKRGGKDVRAAFYAGIPVIQIVQDDSDPDHLSSADLWRIKAERIRRYLFEHEIVRREAHSKRKRERKATEARNTKRVKADQARAARPEGAKGSPHARARSPSPLSDDE